MEYQKIIDLLDNTPDQPSTFETKNWIEINNESRGMYYKDNQIRFETSVLRSSLCDYNNGSILAKRTVTVQNIAGAGTAANNGSNKVIFKNRSPFFNCIGRTSSAQVDDTHDIEAVMQLYNLTEYNDNYT